MHRSTLRSCSWPISSQLQTLRGHVRLLSGVNAAAISSRDGQSVGNEKLVRKRSGRYNAQDEQRERNMRDLGFLDDLLATLGAQRDYNGGPVVREFQQRVDETIIPFKRPSLDGAGSENAETTNKGEENEVDTKDRSSTSARVLSPCEDPIKTSSKWEGLVRRVQVTADQACEKEVSVTADEHRHGPHRRQSPGGLVQNAEEGTKTSNTGFVRSVEPLDYTAAVIPITELWEWTGANPSTISTPWASYVEDSTGDIHERSITVESR